MAIVFQSDLLHILLGCRHQDWILQLKKQEWHDDPAKPCFAGVCLEYAAVTP